VPGERQREQDRGDLVQAEPVRVLVVDGDQVAGQVVARRRDLALDQVAHVPAVGGHGGRGLDLVPGRETAEAQRRPVPTPLLQLGVVLLWHAHQGEHDVGRQREGQRGDQVELGPAGNAVEQPGRGGLDGQNHGVDSLHAERAGGRLAQPGVLGLVQADHGRLGPVAADEQDLLGFRGYRHQRGLGHRGGVAGRIAEHLLDVSVPGHDVVADRRGEEDRRTFPGPGGEDRVRVGEEFGRERVERFVDGAAGDGDAHRHRAPPRSRRGYRMMPMMGRPAGVVIR
jgi:hypothetical protein